MDHHSAGPRPRAADDDRRLRRHLPRLLVLAVLAVVVGFLVDDPVIGLALVVGLQLLSLLPEVIRHRRGH